MPFVRQRTTKAGTLSTALVEAYRDAQGRPRQRLLASLHGEPTLLKALAKLAAVRAALRKEQEGLAAEAVQANQFYETVTTNIPNWYITSEPAERAEIADLMQQRARLLKRLARVERDLAAIQRDGVVIKRHCTATAAEVQAAIKAHEQARRKAEALVLGMEMMMPGQLREAKAKLRRLST